MEEVLQPRFREESSRVLAKLPVLTKIIDDLGITHVCKWIIILTNIAESLIAIIAIFLKTLACNLFCNSFPKSANNFLQLTITIATR